ncbi:MAG: L-aspartate oxidase [Bacteroidota bacterium]
MFQTDFLVVGSGIAGLIFALKTANHIPESSITIITKSDESESNTKYAQGGLAVVMDFQKDSYEKHISDTVKTGDGLCNKEIVELVIKQGSLLVEELINWGVEFDKTTTGDYQLGKEGGHSAHRVIHHKDVTGLEIERALLRQVHKTSNINVLTHHFALDLITQHHLGQIVTKATPDVECYGIYALNLKTGQVETILSKITLLASGGAGQVYLITTNPAIATGDGIAMAYRAKGRIENMEFVQFHPTALYNPGKSPAFLISEAIRGAGGVLKTMDGKTFMEKYDERKSLAPRDIVARAIDNEMKSRGDDHVYLDCSQIKNDELIKQFPNIYKKCRSIGIDISKEMIPVLPAAHYFCGGIKTDEYGRTSVKNLYACGECASTGLHGANRLASNSLLEALVFAHRSYEDSIKQVKHVNFRKDIPAWNAEGTTHPKELILITHNLNELKIVMSDYMGIVRTNIRLNRAMARLEMLYKETETLYDKTVLSPQLCELRNLISIGYLVVKFAMQRKECKGVHYNMDYI